MMLRGFILGVSLLALGLGAMPARAASFNDAQKTEIEQIVHQYILNNPEILFEAADKHRENQARKADEQSDSYLKTNADKIFNNPNYHAIGNPKASVAFVEFFDYNCGYCKQAFPALQKTVEEDKDIKIIMIDTPILSEQSYNAARWSVAAGKLGKYVEFHTAAMKFQGPKDDANLAKLATEAGLDAAKVRELADTKEVKDQIDANMQIFRDMGLNGTPAFAARDRVIRGFAGPEVLKQIAKDIRDGKTKSIMVPVKK